MGMIITLLAMEGCGEAHVSGCILETEMWGGKVKDGNGEAHVREEDPEGAKTCPRAGSEYVHGGDKNPGLRTPSSPTPGQQLPLLFPELRGLLPEQYEGL